MAALTPDLGALRRLAALAKYRTIVHPEDIWAWDFVENVPALIDALESARSLAARLEKELADKQSAVLALHVEELRTSCCATCGHLWPCATELIFEIDYEALGAPVDEGDQ